MMNYLAIRYYERKPLPLPCRESLIGMTRRPRRRQIHDLAAALRDAPVPERKSLQLARSERPYSLPDITAASTQPTFRPHAVQSPATVGLS